MVYQKIRSISTRLLALFLAVLLIYHTNGNAGSESFGSIQSAALSTGLAAAVFFPGKRPFIFLFAILMWSAMIGFYLAKAWDYAFLLGSVGFGLIFLVTLTYVPELFKTGYIADFQKWFKD